MRLERKENEFEAPPAHRVFHGGLPAAESREVLRRDFRRFRVLRFGSARSSWEGGTPVVRIQMQET